MKERAFARILGPWVVAVIITVMGSQSTGGNIPERSSEIVEYSGTVNWELGYSDVDKLNLATHINYYDDLNNNNLHDPGEPFAATTQGGWGNPKSRIDNSCWLASGCNMLEQLGKIPDANALYMDYALNGVASPGGILTWADTGLQEYVIQQWINDNPAEAAGMQLEKHWRNTIASFLNGHFGWTGRNPRADVNNYLNNGWEVGIGMWPLYENGTHGGGHAITMQAIYSNNTFDNTDSDRDDGGNDLNSYNDAMLGPTLYDGRYYYGWYNDFYSRDFNDWPDGDIGYIVAVIPEPAMLLLLAIGGVQMLRRRRS